MSDHTPGELQIWTSNSFRRLGTNGRDGGLVCEPITQPDGHPDLYFRNGGPDGPDARRMLATWNACRGIKTADLDQASKTGLLALSRALQGERDELAKALGDACTLLDGWINTKCPKRYQAEHRADVDRKRALLVEHPPKVATE